MLRVVAAAAVLAAVSASAFELPSGAITLGAHCLDDDGGGHSAVPVTFGFADSAPNQQCTVANDVAPTDSLSVFNGAGNSFFVGVEDQWSFDRGVIEQVCITPDGSIPASEECFSFSIEIPDRAFRSANVTLSGATAINNMIIRIRLGPSSLDPDDFWPGDYHYYLASVSEPAPPASLVTGFGLIVYGDANIASGNVGGRAAVGGNLVAGTASIGTDVCSENLDTASMGPGVQSMLACAGQRPWALLVDGDATWPSGGLYPRAATACGTNQNVYEECAYVNGAVLGAPGGASPLASQLCNNTAVTAPCTGAGCLSTAFTASKAAVDTALSGASSVNGGVTFESKWSGIILNCSASTTASRYVVTIPRAEWNAATWFTTTIECNPMAAWTVILGDGSDLGTNVSFSGGSFPSRVGGTWFLVEGSATVTVSGMDIPGSLIAPSASVVQTGGNVNGYLVANTYDASAASINTPCSSLRSDINTDEILVHIGAAVRPSAPDGRRQTSQNPNCVPDDVIIVPAHGAIRFNDTVRVGGAETVRVAELLTIGDAREPAFRFTTPLTGNYPSRTATVEGVVVADKDDPKNLRHVDTWCTPATPPPSEASSASTAVAAAALVAAGAALAA